MTSRKSILIGAISLAAAVASAQYSIDWWTVDGGGRASTGGVYQVSSTVGQPDAGVMSGGQFTLIGGFWAVVAVQTLGAPTLISRQRLRVRPPLHGRRTHRAFIANQPDSDAACVDECPQRQHSPHHRSNDGSDEIYRLIYPWNCFTK